MNMANDRRLSFMSGYIFNKQHVVNMLNIRGACRNLMGMSPSEKKLYLRMYTRKFHQYSFELDMFYSYFNKINTILYHASDFISVCYNKKLQRLFVPKCYYERSSKFFLKTLKFIGEWDAIDKVHFSEFSNEFGRKLYEYQKDPAHLVATSFKTGEIDWPMPDTYFKSIDPTVRGFSFLFPNNTEIISYNLGPIGDLINIESTQEEVYNVLSSEVFFVSQRKRN